MARTEVNNFSVIQEGSVQLLFVTTRIVAYTGRVPYGYSPTLIPNWMGNTVREYWIISLYNMSHTLYLTIALQYVVNICPEAVNRTSELSQPSTSCGDKLDFCSNLVITVCCSYWFSLHRCCMNVMPHVIMNKSEINNWIINCWSDCSAHMHRIMWIPVTLQLPDTALPCLYDRICLVKGTMICYWHLAAPLRTFDLGLNYIKPHLSFECVKHVIPAVCIACS